MVAEQPAAGTDINQMGVAAFPFNVIRVARTVFGDGEILETPAFGKVMEIN